tara:strand:- start:581 stop:832 length:252 start_codon:yes stop_codon:yes gene_type:complete
MLKGLKMKDKELFSSSFEAFSDDLKINLSKQEFNKDVVAAIKKAPSIKVLNFNFNGLSVSGRLAGFFRLTSNICFKSISFQFP